MNRNFSPALSLVGAFLAAAAFVSGCSSESDDAAKPVSIDAQVECPADAVTMKNVCITPDRAEGDYRHLPGFGGNFETWYHVPTKKLVAVPRTSGTGDVLYQAARSLCAGAHAYGPFDLPVTFALPADTVLRDFVVSEGLMRVLPLAGRFWTSTADSDGDLNVLDLPGGSSYGYGDPAGATARVICVAEVTS